MRASGRRFTTRLVRALGIALLAPGCVIVARGESAFAGDHALEDIAGLRIDLPSTPLTIESCDATLPELCPARLSYSGVWRSIGGTRADAREHAREAAIVFEAHDGFGTLRADEPPSADGLVDLEMDTIVLPNDRALEIRTTRGDVAVFGHAAPLDVDVDTGNVSIDGGDDGLAVRIREGHVDATWAGFAWIAAERGNVRARQRGDARDLEIDCTRGDIEVSLASDANLDLVIEAKDIRVRTRAIRVLTSGRLERRTGTAQTRIHLRAPAGTVTVRD